MTIYRVTPAQFLAVQNARIAAQADSMLDARQATLLLEVIERLLASVRSRATHIGQVNEWLSHMIEEGHAGILPGAEQDQLAALLAQGGILGLDDTGFDGRMW